MKPRERLIKSGASSLSTPELLAILLRTGVKGVSVFDLSKKLFDEFEGSLINLMNASIKEIESVEGVGTVKAVTLKAAFELGRRLHEELQNVPKKLDNPRKVFEYCQDMRFLDKEMVRVLCLDSKLHLITHVDVSLGTTSSSLIHPRDVFRAAVRTNSSGIILVHNHPSGDPTPSFEDKKITEILKKAGEILGIELIDHIIVSKRSYYSFKRNGGEDVDIKGKSSESGERAYKNKELGEACFSNRSRYEGSCKKVGRR